MSLGPMTFWPSTAQHLSFTNDASGTYTCTHNPNKFSITGYTKAKGQAPLYPASGVLIGGQEFASLSIPLEWDEMTWAEYQALSAYHLVPSTLVDFNDEGYYGWLQLGTFNWIPGNIAKTGNVKANFVVSAPDNGLTHTITSIATPSSGNLAASILSGSGSIPISTLYYGLTFWSNWGQTAISPIVTANITVANSIVHLTWTAPTSIFYRKATLWVASSSGGFTSGSLCYVKADIYNLFDQEWYDYSGLTGLSSQAIIPSRNQAFTGRWTGGTWTPHA